MALKDTARSDVNGYIRLLGVCANMEKVISKLGLEDYSGWTNEWVGKAGEIEVKAGNEDEVKELTKKLVDVLGRVEKGFDESRGKFTITAVCDGVEIRVVHGGSPTCHVVSVVTEEWVPTVPGYKKQSTKFVATGDCGSLLAPGKEVFTLERTE